ncbi:MAG: 30S ribosomal protein S6--L-glutamate ligase [Planctomycetaceae bacterium]
MVPDPDESSAPQVSPNDPAEFDDVEPEEQRPLRIAILSQKSSLYSTRRLREAGLQRGHHVEVIDYLRCYMDITSQRPRVLFAGRELNNFDAIIPRIGASYTFYGTAVVRQFEMMNVFSANESQSITRSRDKLRCLQLLAREGIGLPVTGFAHSTKDITGLMDVVGGAPLVIKLIEGTQGVGVILGETQKAAEAVIEAFRTLDANILVQEFIKEAQGCDIRCFVVGKRVVAAMLRKAPEGEFRSNLHRGGTAYKVKLTPEEKETALRAAKAMGLRVAGVDILRSNRGPVVMEVNSSPGLEGIEAATKVNVAGKIIEFIERNVGRGNKDRIRG